MPIIMPDTSEAADQELSVAATYRAKITKVEPSKSKKGGDMLVCDFKFTAPKAQGGESRIVTRRSWLNTSGAGSFGFDQLLRCIGEAALADQIKANPGRVPVDTDLILNKEVQVVLGNQLYEGKMVDTVSSFLPV